MTHWVTFGLCEVVNNFFLFYVSEHISSPDEGDVTAGTFEEHVRQSSQHWDIVLTSIDFLQRSLNPDHNPNLNLTSIYCFNLNLNKSQEIAFCWHTPDGPRFGGNCCLLLDLYNKYWGGSNLEQKPSVHFLPLI